MTREWQPGDVAMLRSPLGQEFMAVRTKGGDSGDYWSAPTNWPLGVPADECDIRPLVVLDPKAHRFYPELLVRALRTKTGYTTLADAIEAQTCPPKPPEPGLWAVVGAHIEGGPRRRWVHHEEDRWICDSGEWRYWDDLADADPELIREGISDA